MVKSNAAITTSGTNAFGILAQSVGGGGGAVISTGDAVTPTFTMGFGNASKVTVNINASITTSGAGAHGVVAQSVSGGGGLVTDGTTTVMQGGKLGHSGLVQVNVAAGVNVLATGKGAVGIKTWSSTDPIVDIAAGASVTGGAGGSAVEFEGPTNQLDNHGSVGSTDGADGMAVRTLSGDTTITNGGRMQGNVALAQGGDNLLHNVGTGTLIAGSSLDLGARGLLRNEGVLTGGRAPGAVTRIHGSLQQLAGGTMQLRMDVASSRVDSFQVSGSARLQGNLRTTLVNGGLMRPGTVALGTILHAAGGVDMSGLSIGRTAIMQYAVRQNGGDLSLSSTADFSPAGLGRDGVRLGALIARAQDQGLPHFHALVARLVEVPTVKQLSRAYWNVSGASASAVTVAQERMTTAFNRTLLQRGDQASGSRVTSAPQGSGAWQDRRDETWVQAYGDDTRRGLDASHSDGDMSANSHALVIGHDRQITPDTTIGFALGSGMQHVAVAQPFSARSNVVQAGVYAMQQWDAAYASAAVSYASYRTTTHRSLSVIDAAYNADVDAHSVATRLEAGYRLAGKSFAVSPYAALQAQRITTPGYTENAASAKAPALALGYRHRSVNDLRSELGLSLDKTVAMSARTSLALRASTAWVHNASNNPDLHASFSTLPAGSFSNAALASTENLAQVSAGAKIRFAERWSAGMDINAEFAHDARTIAGWATLQYRW
jgi:outer membrane autotransporter protein